MTYRNMITALIVGMVAFGAANAQQAPAADKKAPTQQQAKSETKPDSGAKKSSKKSSKSSKAKTEAKKDTTKTKKG